MTDVLITCMFALYPMTTAPNDKVRQGKREC